jgi:RloB-like protein
VAEEKTQVLVVCGGERTEADYFTGLGRLYRARLTVKPKGDSPANLVRRAERLRKVYPDDFDEVWCVVDVDEFDIAAATVAARRSGVELAISNPFFEFWLPLHFRQPCGPAKACREIVGHLSRCLPGYDKTRLDFAHFAEHVPQAIERARRTDPATNPSTTVWRLVEKVLGSAEVRVSDGGRLP